MCVYFTLVLLQPVTFYMEGREDTEHPSLVLDQHLHLAHQVSGQGQSLFDVVALGHF